MDRDERIERLGRARLYFVCDAGFAPAEMEALLASALAGGCDVLQLRDKHAPEGALRAAARLFGDAARDAGALFVLNDRPDLAAEVGAHGVHVGQDDASIAEARSRLGPEPIIGLSTHSPAQLDAALTAPADRRADYLSVGPVWRTPTKQGRPAAGLDYVRYAASRSEIPWFAIGGIDADNVDRVRAAGARRIVVVRAIRDAAEPRAAAALLRDRIGADLEVAGS